MEKELINLDNIDFRAYDPIGQCLTGFIYCIDCNCLHECNFLNNKRKLWESRI